MKEFITTSEVRWADLDPSFHVLHSRYYDFGVHCRMVFLLQHELTAELMKQLHIGLYFSGNNAFLKRTEI